MKCKNCRALHWHPNKGFYCTVPDCKPDNTKDDVKELYEYVTGGIGHLNKIRVGGLE